MEKLSFKKRLLIFIIVIVSVGTLGAVTVLTFVKDLGEAYKMLG